MITHLPETDFLRDNLVNLEDGILNDSQKLEFLPKFLVFFFACFFFFVLCASVCVFFILCNFIAILFAAWPSHLARLALAISKWLCSFFYC